jgi:folate-dependent phosphoribosylglycinamide formyltransferase PurN
VIGPGIVVSSLRVVILSGADVGPLAQLLRRIHREVPGVAICGVLYQLPPPPKPFHFRLTRFLKNLADRDYLSYVIDSSLQSCLNQCARTGHALLRVLHASPRVSSPMHRQGREVLSGACDAIDCPLHETRNVHSPEALEFVRDLRVDLGVVWGTRLLKPELFELPRLGSINIHRKKVPEYRGSGPTGMWELLDGQTEVGITIHRVEVALDAGPVLDSGAVPIEPSDTLATLERKVHVAGNDLLVRFLTRAASGRWRATPQVGAAREFRRRSPHHLRKYGKQIARERMPPGKPNRAHSLPALLIRTLACAPYVLTRNWLRRIRGSFPIVILSHDVGAGRADSDALAFDTLLRHLDFLRKHYQIVSLDEATALLRHGRITRPTVALTFDGESGDSFIKVRAALRELDHGAALFVSARQVIDRDHCHDEGSAAGTAGLLTWNQVVDLRQQGIDIGGRLNGHHGPDTHRYALYSCIVGSKQEFERRLGREVQHACLSRQRLAAVPSSVVDITKTAYRYVLSDEGTPNWPPSDGQIWHLSRCRQVNNLWELELVLQQCLKA